MELTRIEMLVESKVSWSFYVRLLFNFQYLQRMGYEKSSCKPTFGLSLVVTLWHRLEFRISWPNSLLITNIYIYIKVKFPRYRPGVAQRVGRGIALLFHDRGTRRGWMVSSTPRPHFTPGKDLLLILQEAGWAPGPVWMGGNSRPHRYSIPNLPAGSSVTITTELTGAGCM